MYTVEDTHDDGGRTEKVSGLVGGDRDDSAVDSVV
jgi:hypothetical protein